MSPARTVPDTWEERRALRLARSRAHAAFDRTWKTGNMRKSQAYDVMAQYMGVSKESAHIGLFTVAQCEKLVAMFSSPRAAYTRNRNYKMEQNVTL